jgi:hypothetical protein
MKRLTEKTKITTIDSDTGEVLDVQTTESIKIITGKVETEKFWFVYTSLITLLQGDKPTRTAISVFATLLGRYGSSTIGITKSLKEEIATIVSTSLKSVERCLSELTECNMIIRSGRATYTINPTYAFIGNTQSRKELILKLSEK